MPYKTTIEIICPICGAKFVTKNRQKKTCSRSCGGKSSIPFHKKKTQKQIQKQSDSLKLKYKTDPDYRVRVSEGLKQYYQSNPDKIVKGEVLSKRIGKTTKGKYNKAPKSILEFSKRTITKVLKRIGIGCSNCGWNKAACDIHHINGRKIENPHDHKNLTYICPNCHRLCHAGKIKKEELLNLNDHIGDKWLQYYYG